MPNWAYTRYKIEGDKEQLNTLHNTIKSLEGNSLVENGFGDLWLGNLVHALGGDYEKIYCRGQILDYQLSKDEDYLIIDTETAWGEMDEVRHFLEEKFPLLTIWYISEEPGMIIYITNDRTGEVFHTKYHLDFSNGETSFEDDYKDLKSVMQVLLDEGILKEPVELSVPAIREALKNAPGVEEDGWACLNEYEIVDD